MVNQLKRYNSTTNDLARRVVTTIPGVKAVILAADQKPDDMLTTLKAGVCGFLCQDIPGERLIKSSELIALGATVVASPVFLGAVGGWKDAIHRR